MLYFSPQLGDVGLQGSERDGSPGPAGPPISGIQDQILATQLRRLIREATPTISEVYHERNIGLGLAPPLSKLLLPTGGNCDEESVLLSELRENPDPHSPHDNKSKPWLSTAALQRFYSEERETENKQRGGSPCSELSRRDEGDGRSIADSQCSAGSYKCGTTLRPALASTTGARPYEEKSPCVLGFNEDANEDSVQPVASLGKIRALHPPPPPIPNVRTLTKQ